MPTLKIFVFACCLVAVTGTVLADHVAPADLDKTIRSLREKYSIAGLSVIALRDGEIRWQGHQGWADAARELPVTSDTKFRIASISKTVTAAALMQLWEQGKFQLDDDISPYLGFPVVNPHHPDKPVTFRHLLTHTSGLLDGPNYDRFLQVTYENPAQAPALKELLGKGGSHYSNGANYSTNAPGTRYAYSNLGFGLLGTLVEKISGERFDTYCSRRILKPLGMTASFNVADLPDVNHLAVLYRPGAIGWEPQFDHFQGVAPTNRVGPSYQPGRNALVLGPQGGLRTSAADLAKFMKVFMAPDSSHPATILKPETVRLMLQQHWKDPNGPAESGGRGLGFARTSGLFPGELWVGHSGSAYGMISDMFFQADGSLGVILITNGSKPGKETAGFDEMEREIFVAVRDFLQALPARPE